MNDDAIPFFDIGGHALARHALDIALEVKTEVEKLKRDAVWRAEIRLRVARGESLESLDAYEHAALVLSWVEDQHPEYEQQLREAWALAELERDDL